MMASKPSCPTRRTNRGVSLIIVLIMMIIIVITAATAMRSATSEQRATNNQRVEAMALQYAEAALRFCEFEMATKADGSRYGNINYPNIRGTSPSPPYPAPSSTGWEDPLTWTSTTTGLSSASRTTIPDTALQLNPADVVLPLTRPECIVENMTGGYGYVITARGYSPDYTRDGSGNTLTGSVVWLQSFTQ